VAAACFRQELALLRRTSPAAYGQLMAELPLYLPCLQPDAPLCADELYLLKRLAALEGELDALPCAAALAASGLPARVLRYRLGLLDLDVNAPAESLDQLMAWAGCADQQAALSLSGHLRLLVQAVLAHRMHPAENPADGLLYLPGEAEKADARALLREAGQTFTAGLQADLPAAQWQRFQTQVLARVGERKAYEPLATYLASVMAEPDHTFLQRLLGLQLWVDGFLDAPADAGSPAKVHAALDQLFRLRLGKDGAPARARLLAHVQGGVYACNLHYFYQAVSGSTLPGPAGSTLTDLEALYDTEGDEAERLRTDVEAQLQAYPAQRKQADPPSQGYPGQQGVQRIFEWVRQQVDGLGEALERLFNHLRGGVQALYGSLLRSFDMLGRGLRALLDPQPIVTQWPGGRISTELGTDFRIITKIDGEADAESMLHHQLSVADYTKALRAVWRMVGSVVRWGLSLANTPLSWVKLGLHIAGLIVREAAVTPVAGSAVA
jgi:hypothetical protein